MKIPASKDVQIINKISQLRTELMYSAAMGNYKGFKKANIEYAKMAVDNFELAKQAQSPNIKAPLFSKVGMRMAKVWFLNLFRIKSPEEKQLKTLAKQERLKQEARQFVG